MLRIIIQFCLAVLLDYDHRGSAACMIWITWKHGTGPESNYDCNGVGEVNLYYSISVMDDDDEAWNSFQRSTNSNLCILFVFPIEI